MQSVISFRIMMFKATFNNISVISVISVISPMISICDMHKNMLGGKDKQNSLGSNIYNFVHTLKCSTFL
jgi:hypothetical protein